MTKDVNSQIAREICGKTTLELIDDRCGDWSPSTDRGHAVEALESLPKYLTWRIGREFRDGDYWCIIFNDDNDAEGYPELADVQGKTFCRAICRALLSPRVLKAMRKAREEVPK